MGSILRPKSSGENTSKLTLESPQNVTYPLPTTLKVHQKTNINGPNKKHQFNEYLLYEHEFHGDTFISAHLQRLQHGIIDSPNISGDRKHVTFVAIEFCFHPAFEHDHRFRNCIIEVTASRDKSSVGEKVDSGKEMLRFIKYAPHLAFGRISSESLKWNFQLGAALGVTQGPVDVSINPSGSYERDRTVGTMMKIQGTTRSIPKSLLPPNSAHHDPPARSDLRDRRIVWSLEENDQQEAGIPREFTFVFLVEQPHVYGGKVVDDVVIGDISTVFKDLTIGIKVKPSVTGFGVDGFDNEFQNTTVKGEVGQRFCTADELKLQGEQEQSQPTLARITAPVTAVKDSASTVVKKSAYSIKKQLSTSSSANGTGNAIATTKTTNPTAGSATITSATPTTNPAPVQTASPTDKVPTLADSVDGSASDALVSLFKLNRSPSVGPEKARSKSMGPPAVTLDKGLNAGLTSKEARSATMNSEKSLAPQVDKKLFNFALMEGSFEDLIELPGNAITSVQPTLPV